ncbi:MAG: PhzF family phenazine biosynthesis protein [Chitinophagaceae bacterium]|nr:PhzF family phenazine biosynthesis protein [Chitinophagaceae bacterium]
METTPYNLSIPPAVQIVQARVFTHPQTIETKEVLGNPASIVFCTKNFPAKETMKQIAIAEKAPMTAFVLHEYNNHFAIQFFTPSGNEFGLCGHATLIASHFIYEQYGYEKVIFSREGLETTLDTTNVKILGTKEFTQITMPAYIPVLKDIDEADDYISMLGMSTDDVVAFYECQTLNDRIIVLNNTGALRMVQPDFDKLSTKLAVNNIRGLFITALSDVADIDYEVRIFAPHFGIDEDISCGSANCSLLPLWYNLTKAEGDKEFKILCPYDYRTGKMGGIEIGHYNQDNHNVNIGGIISE